MHNRFCICCDKKLESASPVDEQNSPIDGGIYLRSKGNYGSAVYDSCCNPEEIELYICDECLKAKKNFVYKVLPAVTRTETFSLFSEPSQRIQDV